MKRRTPLPRSTKPIKRSTVKKKAGKPKRFAARRSSQYTAWVKLQPCAVAGFWFQDKVLHICNGLLEVHHVRTRGAGGDDERNTVNLCRYAHARFHDHGAKTFDADYAINLRAYAQTLYNQWQEI